MAKNFKANVFAAGFAGDPTTPPGVAAAIGDLLPRLGTTELYQKSGPLDTDWSRFYSTTAADVRFPTLRLLDPGAANRPVVISAGATLGYVFAIGNELFFETPLISDRDPAADVIIAVSWAPSGSEAAKLVSWQANVLPCKDGVNIAAAGTVYTAVDQAVPAVIATYTHSVITVPAAALIDPALQEIHCRISRIASAADPVAPPGIHHLAVIQQRI